MATIQGQINTPRDTTIQATNTALGLLGKDASLQDIKTALLAIVDAITPSIENDYDELTNKPQVNGVTLSGNKTSKQLGIRQTIPMNSAAYALLTSAEKMDPDKDYIITDRNATSAPIDDANISNNKVWSSQKTDNTKADKEAILQTVEECSASTDPDDIAGAAALSSLNSALANIPILKSSDFDTGSVQITRDSSTDMYYGTVNIEAPADASYAVGVCWVNTSWNACAIGVVSNTYISDNKKMFMVWFASSKSMTIPNRRIRIWYI